MLSGYFKSYALPCNTRYEINVPLNFQKSFGVQKSSRNIRINLNMNNYTKITLYYDLISVSRKEIIGTITEQLFLIVC